MKKLYLWVLLLCCSTWLSAQALSENFDTSTDLPSGWTVINNGDINTWEIVNSAANSAPNSVRIAYSSAAHDDYLITPQFTVTSSSNLFKFMAKNYSSYYVEDFDVLLSTSGNNAADFTTVLESDLEPDHESFEEFVVDLSDYEGQNVYIAFHSTTTDKFYLYIDDVETVEAMDSDNDGIFDHNDNCPDTANPDQADTDDDGIGDVCEPDTDGDGIIDDIDNCPNTANPDQADSNDNGIGDVCDPNIDMTLTCGEDYNTVYCYDSYDNFTWLVSSNSGGPVTITFNAGNLEASTYNGNTYDNLEIYDGSDDTGILLFNSNDGATNNPDNNNRLDLSGLNFTAESGTLYATFTADSSVACGSGSSDFEAMDFTFSCDAEFDCPDLEANVGDSCDDNDSNTENDVITDDCGCEGTPIVMEDCPAPTEVNIVRNSAVQVAISTDVAVWDMYVDILNNAPTFTSRPKSHWNNLTNTYVNSNVNPEWTYYLWFRNQCDSVTSEYVGPYMVEPYVMARIYPNPTSRNINISGINAESVRIFDIHGNVIFKSAVNDNKIDISSLQTGSYTIELIDENNNVTTERIIKR